MQSPEPQPAMRTTEPSIQLPLGGRPMTPLQAWLPAPCCMDRLPVSLSLPLSSQTTVLPVQKTKDRFHRSRASHPWAFCMNSILSSQM